MDKNKEQFVGYLAIPHERVGVLIGGSGKVKRRIEEKTGVKLVINGDTGEVDVISNAGADPMGVLKAESIVTAIGRGFSPVRAFELMADNVILRVINLVEVVGHSRKALERQKARLIGSKGKTRALIEEMTDTKISIYGKTASIIGEEESVGMASNAVRMIASGVPHGDVYKVIRNWKKAGL